MRYILLSAALAGCSWTTFDDLGKTAWAQSTQTPNIGSTDYALAILGTTTTDHPGQLSVLSGDTNSYSTLTYDAKGNSSLGPSPQRLGQFFITSLGTPPIFVANDAGDCAVVAQASNGSNTYIVVYNACSASAVATPIQSSAAPDSATYIGSNLVVAAGENLYVMDATVGPTWCGIPEAAAAVGGDANTLWVWTTAGNLLSVPQTSLVGTGKCAVMMMNPAPVTGTPVTPTSSLATNFVAASGSTVQPVGNFVVLAGHQTQSPTASVIVANTAGGTANSLVGSPLSAPGLQSATAGALGGAGTFVALGFPTNETSGTVELHAFDATAGTLDATVAEKLADEQGSNTQFGRSVAIMKFNASTVLVVAAKGEVYAYFRTLLYGETRQQ